MTRKNDVSKKFYDHISYISWARRRGVSLKEIAETIGLTPPSLKRYIDKTKIK